MAAVVEKLPAALEKKKAGATEIERVRIEIREDSSEKDAIFITLVLSDPPAGLETWPIDDLWALRRLTKDEVARLERESGGEIPVRWGVVFEPESQDELEDEDSADLIDVDG